MTDPLSRVHKCLLPTGSGPLSLEELEGLGRQRRGQPVFRPLSQSAGLRSGPSLCFSSISDHNLDRGHKSTPLHREWLRPRPLLSP